MQQPSRSADTAQHINGGKSLKRFSAAASLALSFVISTALPPVVCIAGSASLNSKMHRSEAMKMLSLRFSLR
jgi:hypothetical protein